MSVKTVATTGIARSVAKVAANMASTVVIDTSIPIGIVGGEMDEKKLALNATAAANATYRAHGLRSARQEDSE